jgi:hypothetical protein
VERLTVCIFEGKSRRQAARFEPGYDCQDADIPYPGYIRSNSGTAGARPFGSSDRSCRGSRQDGEQPHTAKRISKGLRIEHGYASGYSLATCYKSHTSRRITFQAEGRCTNDVDAHVPRSPKMMPPSREFAFASRNVCSLGRTRLTPTLRFLIAP